MMLAWFVAVSNVLIALLGVTNRSKIRQVHREVKTEPGTTLATKTEEVVEATNGKA